MKSREAAKGMTPRQLDVLGELDAAMRCNRASTVTPMMCGGTDGSYHCSTLAQLCRKGLAGRRKYGICGDCSCRCGPEAMFGHRCRGAFQYWITEEGKETLRAAQGVSGETR